MFMQMAIFFSLSKCYLLSLTSIPVAIQAIKCHFYIKFHETSFIVWKQKSTFSLSSIRKMCAVSSQTLRTD